MNISSLVFKSICSLILVIFFHIESVSQIDKNSLSKWSMNAEMGVLPIKSLSFGTAPGFLGQIGVNYNYRHFVSLGVFGQSLLYHASNDLLSLDEKTIDLSSISYSSFGPSLGFRFRAFNIEVMPKLDIGYNVLVGRAIDFPTNPKGFIDFRYLSLNPKLYVGYCFTPFMTIGANIGLNRQVHSYKGRELEEFNPNSVNGSLFVSFFFRSTDYLPKQPGDTSKYSNKDIRIPYWK